MINFNGWDGPVEFRIDQLLEVFNPEDIKRQCSHIMEGLYYLNFFLLIG